MGSTTKAASHWMDKELLGKEESEVERQERLDAEERAGKDAEQLAAAREKARRDAIMKRLDAEVSVRMKTPGRQQTLLTGTRELNAGVLPSANNTLLTTGKK